jgi:malate dehydrogenase (oxaloacetate-decarboxylating)
VTLAALLAGIHATKIPMSQQRIIVYGAGTAGVGIADQLYNAMLREGVSEEKAREQFWLFDRTGILKEGMSITDFQQPYARSKNETDIPVGADLLTVVKAVKPTILIGCSTVRNAFTQAVVEEMCQHVEHPIILPLSNPPERAEAAAADLIHWSLGKALIATGSPSEPVEFQGKEYIITQCNNALSFPGLGIGAVATKASQVTDNMLWAAANAISQQAPVREDPTLPLLPLITNIPELACHVALAVAKQAIEDGVARVRPPLDLKAFMQEHIWRPYYRPIKAAKGS